ncbi:DUF5018-related domain-containing protein [Pedobacter nutrimenti]|uniref:DUF5018-related domain-containing protein n=1 Tax=Pedobacter nutrimenti TaxID=1241337 RepID=UPI0029311D41|nr:DUF1406 domain-containing protein [Pedobacter nutrimenti]
MKNSKIQFIAFLMIISLGACTKARIEPDFSIYGDKAFITGITTFDYITITRKLNYNEEVTGYQVRGLANASTIDKVNFKISVLVTNPAADLSKMGIRISNDATKIEPLNGAPAAGTIGDYSKGPYVYRVYSADGTIHDWTISFTK